MKQLFATRLRSLLAAALLLAAGATLPALATRVVPSYTILDPTVQGITQVRIHPRSEAQPNELDLDVYYTLEADTPGVKVDQRYGSVTIQLSGAAKTSLVNYLTANALPAIAAQGGL